MFFCNCLLADFINRFSLLNLINVFIKYDHIGSFFLFSYYLMQNLSSYIFLLIFLSCSSSKVFFVLFTRYLTHFLLGLHLLEW